jgi:hypothetical protein
VRVARGIDGYLDWFIPPLATITPSSSITSNLSEGPPSWLVEIHQKLWGRRDLFDQIFRKANLTKSDFIELQAWLDGLNPSRSSESYISPDVLPTKLDFLRSRSFVDVATASRFATCNAGSHGNLVPELVIDTSKDLTPPIANAMDADAVDTDALNVGAVGADAMNDPMDIDVDNATELSEGSTSPFSDLFRYTRVSDPDNSPLYTIQQILAEKQEFLCRTPWPAMYLTHFWPVSRWQFTCITNDSAAIQWTYHLGQMFLYVRACPSPLLPVCLILCQSAWPIQSMRSWCVG